MLILNTRRIISTLNMARKWYFDISTELTSESKLLTINVCYLEKDIHSMTVPVS